MAQKTVISIALDTKNDKDILRWLGQQDNRSAAIREAIRNHLGRNGVTLGDVYQAVKGLERKIKVGIAIAGDGDVDHQAEQDEPPEAAAALDALANL